jgi:NADH dehydrogenase
MSFKLVTVFGGSGFIGRHFVRRIAATGATVRVATRRPQSAKFLRPMCNVGQVVPMGVDIFDDAEVAQAVAGADAVVNLIGILAQSGKQRFDTVQGKAPGRIASESAAAGVKHLVQISAIGADAASKSRYARTKAEGEAAVLAAFPKAVILRPSIVFGPEDQFFNRFAAMAQFSPFLPLIGGGKTKFQPVYVADVADAIMAALRRHDAQGKVFELGGPHVYTFRQLMALTLDMIGRDRKLLSLPWGLASLQAAMLELLPGAPLTRDQVTLLRTDNVVHEGALTLGDLGIAATAAEVILPTYLDRFRVGGRFSAIRRAS